MADALPRFRAAAVQAAPAFLDREATLEIVAGWTQRAAAEGAELVVFGESFLPGFPVWNLVLAPVDQHELYEHLYREAIEIPGPAAEALGRIAMAHGVHLSVGVTERSATSTGTMFNTNLLFAPSGRLVNQRRKIVPTWAEKLTWAWGDASQLRPVETPLGRIGVLICGENTNTLARFALLAQGEQVHIATYPPAWPFRRPESGENYDLTRAIELRSAAHSFEGKVHSVVASAVLTNDVIDRVAAVDERARKVLEAAPPAVSLIVHPTGRLCGDALVGEEGILAADIDLADSVSQKEIHDITGAYQRFDLFRFEVDQRPQGPSVLRDDATSPGSLYSTDVSRPGSRPADTGAPPSDTGEGADTDERAER